MSRLRNGRDLRTILQKVHMGLDWLWSSGLKIRESVENDLPTVARVEKNQEFDQIGTRAASRAKETRVLKVPP